MKANALSSLIGKPFALNENAMIEGTIKHDIKGKVLQKTIRSIESKPVGYGETCWQ